MGWLRKEFTVVRWNYNPFQMWCTLLVGIWSVLQLVLGATPGGIFDTVIDHHAQVLVSSAKLFGALICLTGLHMRDLETGLWVEVIGYISLVGTLLIYIVLVAQHTSWHNSGDGYGLSVAVCLASAHRTWQIFLLKAAERRAKKLRDLVVRIQDPADE